MKHKSAITVRPAVGGGSFVIVKTVNYLDKVPGATITKKECQRLMDEEKVQVTVVK